ncbi:hypothetical protein LSTR_LSTR006538 [Laodelphax striatellus]|uniref:Mediator complex subunit Med12 LCEWAV-domain domain-containing protein n=1 Tax=Laodelphax striatellus TaxID=195883 RepID=A0A482X0A9_LAOST|nr:hypothetical protein LSTR_LSTR006538 [Laodelphax striatellus]
MCTLIFQGRICCTVTNPTGPGGGGSTPHPASNKGADANPLDDDGGLFDLKPPPAAKMEAGDHSRGPPPAQDYDESKIDDDLEKLLQHIKEEQQNSMVG